MARKNTIRRHAQRGYYYMGSMPPMYEVRADFKVPVYFWRKQRAGVNEQVSICPQSRRT